MAIAGSGDTQPASTSTSTSKSTGSTSSASSSSGSGVSGAGYSISSSDWSLVKSIASQYGIDPYILVAIGIHETGWGTLGDGRNGNILGVGSYDSGSSYQWAGLENQLRKGAELLRGWGVRSIQDLAAGKAASWATDPKWESGVVSIYNSIKGTNFTASTSTAVRAGQAGAASGGSVAAAGQELTPEDVQAGLASLGFAYGLVKSDKSLWAIFQKAIKEQWDPNTNAGRARFQSAIQNTDWWKKRSESQRKNDMLYYSDPAQFRRGLDEMFKSLSSLSSSLGVSFKSQGEIMALAKAAYRNGLNEQEIRSAIASHFSYDPKKAFGGVAGSSLQHIDELASNYLVPVDNKTKTSWVRKILSGQMDPGTLEAYFQQQAISRMPHLAKELKSGMTVAEIAAPYRQMMAQLLELDPNDITNDDPHVLRGLSMKDQQGQTMTMPLWQYAEMVRKDSRWLKTNNARDQVLGTAHDLLRDFGLVV